MKTGRGALAQYVLVRVSHLLISRTCCISSTFLIDPPLCRLKTLRPSPLLSPSIKLPVSLSPVSPPTEPFCAFFSHLSSFHVLHYSTLWSLAESQPFVPLFLRSTKGGLGKQAGERVFINGGSTSVGRFAIQLAKNKGIYVVTSCSSKSKDAVARLGPDEVRSLPSFPFVFSFSFLR
jgi:hypothetical protein